MENARKSARVEFQNRLRNLLDMMFGEIYPWCADVVSVDADNAATAHVNVVVYNKYEDCQEEMQNAIRSLAEAFSWDITLQIYNMAVEHKFMYCGESDEGSSRNSEVPMNSNVISAERFTETPMESVPEGVYKGEWGGYFVTADIGGDVYRFGTREGIRTPAADCHVEVKNGTITVKTK